MKPRAETLAIILAAIVTAALVVAAWRYRDLPALDETVAPMRGERDGGTR